MVTIDTVRRLLGHEGTDLTDEQLEQMRNEMYGFADVALNLFAARTREVVAQDEDFQQRAVVLEFDAASRSAEGVANKVTWRGSDA